MKFILPIFILMTSMLAAGTASAALLQIEPILLEMNAPATAGSLTIRNDEDSAVSVQTRVFRWVHSNGYETLDPTTDVVASPPIVTLAPGADYTIRILRTATTVVQGEESYRLWVDQLPPSPRLVQSGVNILIRQSIPVFFQASQITRPNVSWALHLQAGRLLITAANSGDERLRIASLKLRDQAGTTASFGNGLVGYVLGRSSMTFIIADPPRGFGASGEVSVAATSDNGPIHAMVPLQTLR
jgi:fimbrial chaperone protein